MIEHPRLLRALIEVEYYASADDYGTDHLASMCRLDEDNIIDDARNLLALIDKAEHFEVRVRPASESWS